MFGGLFFLLSATLRKIPADYCLIIGLALVTLGGVIFVIVDEILRNKKRKKRDSSNQQS
jgi:hypothetical protein